MRQWILAALLICGMLGAGAMAAPKSAAEPLFDLKPGRYAVRVEGMLCSACTHVILAELSILKEVQQAQVDFDKEELLISVPSNRKLTLTNLRKALQRAAHRVNLDTQFEIKYIHYRTT